MARGDQFPDRIFREKLLSCTRAGGSKIGRCFMVVRSSLSDNYLAAVYETTRLDNYSGVSLLTTLVRAAFIHDV
jgi:hypothetical protein